MRHSACGLCGGALVGDIFLCRDRAYCCAEHRRVHMSLGKTALSVWRPVDWTAPPAGCHGWLDWCPTEVLPGLPTASSARTAIMSMCTATGASSMAGTAIVGVGGSAVRHGGATG